VVANDHLVFPAPTEGSTIEAKPTAIPLFDPKQDPEGFASHVPHMEHFYDNSLQTGFMRDVAIDLELLREHVVLLGNQGVGKNKIIDRLCQVGSRSWVPI
jgi:von Willebrand factor A domain-containing protein 8